jgi:DNA-binding NtrC family response regulator
MGDRASILIVDDDREFVGMLVEFLSAAGFDTLAANSVDEALAIVRNKHVGTIVSDIQMKSRSGYELVREVHSLDSSIPVVLMSSFESPLSAEAANKAGASAFVSKPFPLNDLLDLVQSPVTAS